MEQIYDYAVMNAISASSNKWTEADIPLTTTLRTLSASTSVKLRYSIDVKLAGKIMTLPDITALIASVTGHPAMKASGGYVMCATPHVGEFSYLGRVYDPVCPKLAYKWAELQQIGKHPYLTFLTEAANGLRYANISLYGVVTHIDRSIGPHVGQPISLDYGNAFGRPSGLSADSIVIGGIVGWSSKGHYVMDQTGAVSLVNCLDADDIATDWPNLRAMLISEIGRVTELHDGNGQELVSATELMHPAGRLWETEDEPLKTVH